MADPLGAGCGGDALQRSALFRRMFGDPVEIVADPRPAAILPRIDVQVHAPRPGSREFYTLITSGMSDRPMRVPTDLRSARRAELLLYVDVPGPSTIGLLRAIAAMPHAQDLWLGHGHTLPNGDPPQPLFPGSLLTTVLVLHTIVAPERHCDEHFTIGGDPLNMLWLQPITSAECRLKVELGLSVLLDRFNERQVSFVLDPGRTSVG